jgi:hypothetical protein
MPVLDPDAVPRHPLHELVEIAIYRVMHAAPLLVPDPPFCGAGRGEAREIGDQQAAADFEHTRHLPNGGAKIRDVDQREVAHDQVEFLIIERELFRLPDLALPAGIAPSRFRDQGRGRIDADRVYCPLAQRPAEPPFPTAHVEREAKASVVDPAQHGCIEYMLAAPIAALTKRCDPRFGGLVPATADDGSPLAAQT